MPTLCVTDCELLRYNSHLKRHPDDNLRHFLLEQRQHGPLASVKIDVIDKFVDAYDHARHDPAVRSGTTYKKILQHWHFIVFHCIESTTYLHAMLG